MTNVLRTVPPPPAPARERSPLDPGPPVRLIGWLQGPDTGRHRFGLPAAVRITLLVLLALALGTWGFSTLRTNPRQTGLESWYESAKLFTLDMGPADGSSPGPNAQIWIAQLLAAALVARGVLALFRTRLRRSAARHALRGHIVICGAGIHGTRLALELGADHDIVLIDPDPGAPGMQEPRQPHEWRLIGDAVSERTLFDAGVPRAHWLIAVTGDDVVNSQIVSSARALAAAGRMRDRAHVLVQIEDPVLSWFFAEEERGEQGLFVTPFSTNAIAAEALLDEATVHDDDGERPLLAMRHGRAPNLLLAGDHPLLDALALEALHRWRVRQLRDRELDRTESRPPLHVSLYGPGAEARAARLRRRRQHEPGILALEARDAPAPGEQADADEWLGRPGRGDHTIVATQNELDGIALTLGLARALGGRARMTRVSTQFENALDAHVEQQTARSGKLATTAVRSLADLAGRPEAMRGQPALERLARTLGRADPDGARVRAAAVLSQPGLGVRTDPEWRIRPAELPLVASLLALEPPLAPVPVSALLRARLRITLEDQGNLLLAARRLSQQCNPAAFTAWCEYVRHLPAGPVPADALAAERIDDRSVTTLLALRRALGGDRSALEGLTPDGEMLRGTPAVAILAGGAGSLTEADRLVLEPLLTRALAGFPDMVLSGGTDSGLPGIAARAARTARVRIVGYAPEGQGDHALYPLVRETPGSTDFSLLEPLAMWTELLRAGVPPSEVRLLACPGGAITIGEVVLARALGARVGWLDPGGHADESLDERLPFGRSGVVELPADAMTARAFLSGSALEEPLRTALARRLHDAYRARQRDRKAPGDPALASWGELPQTLQASNLALADDIPNKLRLIGKQLARGGGPLRLTADEIERLAEAEHGRWNVERLAAGWRGGERQIDHTTTPDIRPWSELSDAVREYDREAVRHVAAALAAEGWGVSDG